MDKSTQNSSAAPSAADDSVPLEDFLKHPAVRRWGPMVLIAVIGFIFLMPTLKAMYIWDDPQWLTENGVIRDPSAFGVIWTEPKYFPHYYPLVFSTFWLEYRLWGLGSAGPDGIVRGAGYHFDNLMMHLGSALIIFAILKRLKLPGRTLGAWIAATLFAIHPVNVESVAWAAERKNCLCGILFFGALFWGLRFFAVTKDEADARERGEFPWHRGWYAAALALFMAAMLAKTVACVLPPVFLLMIWWRRGRISVREVLLTLPFFIIGIGLGAVTTMVEQESAGATGQEFAYSAVQRVLIAGNAFWFYIGKLIWPMPVMQIYKRFPIEAGSAAMPGWLYVGPAAFIGLAAVLFALRKKLTRGPLTAILFFAGTLAPALGFINFYTMVFTFVADHYQYLSCIGIIVLVVEGMLWGLGQLAKRIPSEDPQRLVRLATGLVFGGIILSFGTQSYGASSLYNNSIALWSYNAENNPDNFGVWDNLASAYLQQTPPQREEAIGAFQKAIAVAPQDWRAYHQLGMQYLALNDTDNATKYLQRAEELMPAFIRGRRADFIENLAGNLARAGNKWDIAHTSAFALARNDEDHGNWDKAIEEYKQELQTYPNDAESYLGIGNCYFRKDQYPTALEYYRKAIEKDPKFAMAYVDMGAALRMLNREQEAIDAFQTARRLDPMVLVHAPGFLQMAAQILRNGGPTQPATAPTVPSPH